MSRTTSLAAAAAALLLALPATATATATATSAEPLPVGSAHGVRIQHTRGGIVFRFGDKAAGLYRQIAGKRVEIGCTWLEPNEKLGVALAGESSGTYERAPRKRAPLRYSGNVRGADYCTITPSVRGAPGDPGEPVVAVPLTQTGAVTLDEREKAGWLYGVLTYAGVLADRTSPSAYLLPARFVAGRFARDIAREGLRLVALAAPTDTPPPSALGYWSDGRRSATVVVLSASGRRLHIDVAAGGEISTNVLGIMLGMM